MRLIDAGHATDIDVRNPVRLQQMSGRRVTAATAAADPATVTSSSASSSAAMQNAFFALLAMMAKKQTPAMTKSSATRPLAAPVDSRSFSSSASSRSSFAPPTDKYTEGDHKEGGEGDDDVLEDQRVEATDIHNDDDDVDEGSDKRAVDDIANVDDDEDHKDKDDNDDDEDHDDDGKGSTFDERAVLRRVDTGFRGDESKEKAKNSRGSRAGSGSGDRDIKRDNDDDENHERTDVSSTTKKKIDRVIRKGGGNHKNGLHRPLQSAIQKEHRQRVRTVVVYLSGRLFIATISLV